jgi:hypothetical protein
LTDRIALFLAFCVIAIFLADYLLFGGTLPLTLGRHFVDLLGYLAFWR